MDRVQVVVTLSKDMSLLLSAIANAPLGGVTDIPTTLKVAQVRGYRLRPPLVDGRTGGETTELWRWAVNADS